MKNLYLKLMLICFGTSIAQQNLQNSNWAIGTNGGLEFSGATGPITTALPGDPSMSSASVSDQEGNLLFYTNGETVWNANHTVMVNGTDLLGHGGDFTQNDVIIPDPADINRYYIVTISSNEEVGQQHGLRFTRVDMSDGIGQVLNPKNIPLPDHLGNPIDDSHPINYGKITTAKHSNGLDYWLIANVGQRIYVYIINHNGIFFVSSVNSPLPAAQVVDNFGDICSSHGPMKISQQNDKILVGFSSTLDPGFQFPRGRIFIGLFDNLTGSIFGFHELDTNNNIHDVYLTGAEFSASGNVVHRFYEADGVSGEAISTNITVDPRYPDATWTVINEVIVPIPWARNLQIGIDGLIYFENYNLSANHPDYLGVILSPEQIPYQITFNSVNVNNLTGYAQNIPPWVQWQPCHRFLTTAEQITSSRNRERAQWISASNEILNSSTRVVYHAGNFIDLTPGFEATNNSQFAAYIEGCTNNSSFVYRDYLASNNSNDSNETHNEAVLNGLSITPNPSNSSIEIRMKNSQFNKVEIVSIEGRKVYEASVGNSDKIQIDVSNYQNGIYIVTIIDSNGQQFSQKLIKN